MNNIRLFLITSLILCGITVNVTAKSKIKPVQFHFEYNCQLNGTVKDNALVPNTLSWDDNYNIKNQIRLDLIITPSEYYNFNIWSMDKFKLLFVWDGWAGIVTYPSNELYFGIENNFPIKKAITIGAHFEMYMFHQFIYPNLSGISLYVAPVLELSGDYDFGLSWGIKSIFKFYFFPKLDTDYMLFDFTIDDLFISYDFMHFIDHDSIGGGLLVNMSMSSTFFRSEYKIDNSMVDSIDKLDHFVGFKFNFYNVQPLVGYYGLVRFTETGTNSGSFDAYVSSGIKVGVEFEKDRIKASIIYTGLIQVHAPAPPTIKYENWFNTISTSVTFKI